MSLNLILELILLITGVVSILIIVRALPRTSELTSEELARYSLRPRLKKLSSWALSISHDISTSAYKYFMRIVAYFSKHTHRISTYSIARVEKMKSEKREAIASEKEKEEGFESALEDRG